VIDDELPTPEEILRSRPLVYFATVEDDKPRVRPVTLIEDQGKLFVITRMKDDKVSQIRKNGNVEIVAPHRQGDAVVFIRMSARAFIEEDPAERARVAEAVEWFGDYFDTPSSPDYALVRIQPDVILYKKPGIREPVPIPKLSF
jgi:uncharacterized pyridoxamine 5'-phosphate oxidase family protein